MQLFQLNHDKTFYHHKKTCKHKAIVAASSSLAQLESGFEDLAMFGTTSDFSASDFDFVL